MKPRILFTARLSFPLASAIAAMLVPQAVQAQQYWNTNGTGAAINAANWGTAPGGPFTSAFTANGDIVFGANSSVTGASVDVGNITVGDGFTVTFTAGGTLGTGGNVRTLDVGTGATLNLAGQALSTAAGTGFIKNGSGTLISSNGNTYGGGFTINAGTVAVGGVNAMGGAAGNTLTINGGTIRSNATTARDLTGKYAGGITIGGNFTLGDAVNNGALTFTNNMNLGAASRTITMNSGATFSGAISGSEGVGITKNGTGTLTLSGANTFTGAIEVNQGTLQAGGTTAFGTGTGNLSVAAGAQLRFQPGGTLTTTRAITATGTGTGTGAITAGGSTIVNLNGGITLTGDTTMKGDGGCSFNTISGSNITGTNTSLTVNLDGSTVSTLSGDLSLGTGSLTKGSTSTLNLNGAVSYTGATTVTGGVLSIGGTTGEILETSSITLQGGTLNLNNTAGNLDRVTGTQALAITSGGGLSLTGNATTDTTEAVGAINLSHYGTLSVTSAIDRITTLTIASFNRPTPKATVLVRGTNLDQSVATNVARITLGDSGASLGTLVGTTTLNNAPVDNAAKDVAIIPWMAGDTNPTGTGSGFVTYDAALGLRVLSAAQAVELTAPYVTATTPENTIVSLGNLTLDNAAGITVNSLMLKTTAATLDSTAANSLTIASGALATSGNVAFGIGSGFSGLTLGNDEGIITVQTNTLTVNTPISVTNGGGLVKAGGGNLTLTAANIYAGKTIHNAGTLTFNSIADVGAGASALGAPTTAAAGTIDAYSGNLTYTGTGHSSDRGINLQALTTGTTISLFNSGTGALTLGGAVTGTGTLFVRGIGGAITLSGVLSHNGGVTLTDSNTLFLTNPNNSFPGNLTISKSIVSVASLADSGINCPIGAGTTITLGQSGFNNTGTLQFTGASGGSSNRAIDIQSNTGNTNGGIIESTVAGKTLTLSGSVTTGGSGTTPRLALNGAGDGALTGPISGVGLAITKNGAGTWLLNGPHTFTGATNVTEGLLHFGGTTRTLNDTTLGAGPAGSSATLGTSADTVILNGNVTYSATNNPNGATIAVGTLDLGTTTRTFTVADSTATAVELVVPPVITGAGGLTKAGAGVLVLTNANAFTGAVQINGTANGNTLRIEHGEALGPVATAKTVTLTGTNRQVSILELANSITVDINKTIGAAGKSYMAQEDSNFGSPVFLRSASGNNTWLGNILINNSGGAYSIESAAGTLTLGDPGTSSVLRNDVASSTRTFDFRGAGDVVVNSRFVNTDGTRSTGINKYGTGTLTLPRTDNEGTSTTLNFALGTTVVGNMADSGSQSSIGAGTSFNFGGTFRHVGAVSSSSNRAFGLIGTSPTLESSGDGPLALTSATAVAFNNGGGSTAAAFNAGDTTLTLVDVWSLMPGMTITGRGIDADTLINAVNYDTRQITLSKPTTLTTLGGRQFPTTAAATSGTNTITISAANAVAANLFTGMGVSAAGIATGTTINAINTTTGVITLSASLSGNIASGANINFNSNSMTVSGGNTIPRTFTLGGTNIGDNQISAPINNPSASILSLVKAGAGKWRLSGNNGYGGTTAVSQGTLLINGTHTGTGVVTVAAGATLGGTGSLAAPVSVSGTLAPGTPIEDLATGPLTLNSGSTLAIEISTGSATADRVLVNGDVLVDGTVNLSLTDLGPNAQLSGGTKLVLVDYSGVWDDTDIVHFNGKPVPNGSNITLSANTFTVDYSDDSEPGGTAMTLTTVSTGTPFQFWVGNPAFGLAAGDQDPTDDPDGDGRNNLVEFALDGHPNDRANAGRLAVSTADSSDGGTARDLNVTLAVRNGATLGTGPGGSVTLTVDGVVYLIEGTAGLTNWDKAVGEISPASALTPAPSAGWTARTFRVTDSDGLPDKHFIRVGIKPAP